MATISAMFKAIFLDIHSYITASAIRLYMYIYIYIELQLYSSGYGTLWRNGDTATNDCTATHPPIGLRLRLYDHRQIYGYFAITAEAMRLLRLYTTTYTTMCTTVRSYIRLYTTLIYIQSHTQAHRSKSPPNPINPEIKPERYINLKAHKLLTLGPQKCQQS